MATRIYKNALRYNNTRCDVHYVDADHFDRIPDDRIVKTHAVCFCDGKMVLVKHIEWNIWGIPGGTREPGESIEQTLKREILEETNCEVLTAEPIGYHKVIMTGDSNHYRAFYICTVKPLGEFHIDPAGGIEAIAWIDPADFKKYIEKKELYKIVIQKALEFRQKKYADPTSQ